mgnify:FL=1
MPKKKDKIHIAYYLGRKKDNPKTTWLDRVICFFSGSKYSHIEIVFDYDTVTHTGEAWSTSPRDDGVRSKIINFGNGHWEVYEHQPLYPISVDTTRAILKNYLGYKYDYFGALGSLFSFLPDSQKRIFCTELCGVALGVANSHRMTPGEFYKKLQAIGQKRVL